MRRPPVFKENLARWATYLVKETGRKTRGAVATVLAVDRPRREESVFNKVTRGLESRTVEGRGGDAIPHCQRNPPSKRV